MGQKKSQDTDLLEYAGKVAEGLFKSDGDSDFDESQLASGSEELLYKTDAELFSGEIEEFTDEEKMPRVIVDNEKNKK